MDTVTAQRTVSGQILAQAGDPCARHEPSAGQSSIPPILEYLDDSVAATSTSSLKPTGKILAQQHRCNSRTCRRCGFFYSMRARDRMLARAHEFARPAMVTFSVAPSRFGNDPLTAYLSIKKERYIARSLEYMGITRWICVMELHESGWPHWHVMFDMPRGNATYKLGWEKWGWTEGSESTPHSGSGFNVGRLNFSPRTSDAPDVAVARIASYITKTPGHPMPAWLLDLPARIWWISSSRRVGAVVRKPKQPKKSTPTAAVPWKAERHAPRPVKTLRTREAACGNSFNFIRKFYDPQTDKAKYRYCGHLDIHVYQWAMSSGLLRGVDDASGRAMFDDVSDFPKMLSGITKAYEQACRRIMLAPPLPANPSWPYADPDDDAWRPRIPIPAPTDPQFLDPLMDSNDSMMGACARSLSGLRAALASLHDWNQATTQKPHPSTWTPAVV